MTTRITTAGIVIKDGKYLVAKRSVGEKNKGLWEFVGGKNRYEETVVETLKREFSEELGVEIEVGNFLAEYEFDNKEVHYFLKAYEVFLLSEDFKLTYHSEYKYVDKKTLKILEMVNSDKEIIKKIV